MVDIKEISTFLSKNREQSGFGKKIRTKAVNTQKCSQSAIRNFERFANEEYEIHLGYNIGISGGKNGDRL